MKKRLWIIIFCMSCLGIAGCGWFADETQQAQEYYQKGLTALEAQKPEEALIQFKNAVQKDPRLSQAHLELGKLYLQQREPSLAYRSLTTTLQQAPDLVVPREMIAQLLMRGRAYELAIPHLEKALVQAGQTPDRLLDLITAFTATDQLDKAREHMDRAVTDYPQNLDVRIHHARFLMSAGQVDKAIAEMEQAAHMAAESPLVQILLARFYERARRFEPALTTYRAAVRKFPQKAIPYMALARFLVRVHQYDQAQQTLQEAFQAGLASRNLYHAKAYLMHLRKRPQEALEAFEAAVNIAPDDQQAMIFLADYHVFLKQYEAARAVYEKVVVRWPELTPIKSKIIELLIAEHQVEAAKGKLETLFEEDSQFAQGHLLQGVLQLQAGEHAQARQSFSRAKELDPQSAEAQFMYGLTFLNETDTKLSLSELLQALEKDPSSLRIRLALAYIYLKTDSLSAALDELDKVLHEQPDNIRGRLMRAAIRVRQNQLVEAIGDYEAVLDQTPQPDMLRFRIAALQNTLGNTQAARQSLQSVLNNPQTRFRVQATQQMTVIMTAQNQYDQALALCQAQIEKFPDQRLEYGLVLGGLYLQKGEMETARRFVGALQVEYPQSDKPLLLLARLEMAQKRWPTAIEHLVQAQVLNPANKGALLQAARLYQQQNDTANAMGLYRRLLEADAQYLPALNDLAYLLAQEQTDLDQALQLALKAQTLAPDHADVVDTLGWIYFQRQAYTLAEPQLLRAHQLKPQRAVFAYHLGRLYTAQNKIGDARLYFQNALDSGIEPNLQNDIEGHLRQLDLARQAQGDIKQTIRRDIQENRLERALERAQNAFQQQPGDADLADLMGQVYLKRGAYSLAKQYVGQAIALDARNPLFHFHLGSARFEEGSLNEARLALQKALDLGLTDDDRMQAQQMMAQIPE